MKRHNIYWIIPLMILFFSLVSCKKEEDVALPSAETYWPRYIASKVATVGCTVKSEGNSYVTGGIYMGTSPNPETTGIQFQIASDTGTFLGQISGLTPGTQYFVKGYARNAKGESLGGEVDFTTPETILDIEDNEYETVKIGTQLWMAENLQATKYDNGDLIGTTTPATLDISGEVTPEYQWPYSGEVSMAGIYGRLYTWYAVTDSRNVCPTGWHIPTDAEWTNLETALGGFNVAGSKLKESGNSHWIHPYNLDATNESCFEALPGGFRDQAGEFSLIENYGYWWSSTGSDVSNAWIRNLSFQAIQISRIDFSKSRGASVRCIKD